MAVSNVELRVNATQAITALKNVDVQAKKFNQTVGGTSSKLKDANHGLRILPKGFFGAGKAANGASLAFKGAAASLATLLGPITAGITLVAAFGKVFSVLAEQDFANAKVRALGVNVEKLNPALASLSNELSGQVSKLDLLTASYDLASAGFGEVAELTDVLKASQLGATGGFSDLATVADATTSVLNSYGLESSKAQKIVDGFIQTQNDGRIVVDQYAQQIGRIAPIAAASGVSIDELNAAIAAITATGVPVESTFAGLRQVISSIIKPTGEASKTAEKLGIDFSAAALQSKGLAGVLSEIVEKSGGSSEEIAKLFGSVEALTAIQPLLNDELVKFNEALKNQANAQGEAAKAAFIASNTIQGQLKRLGSAFTNLAGEGSELGIIIRESLKVAAVTVEALGAAFKIVLAPVRAIFAAVNEVAKAIAEGIGVDATDIVFDLEQSWIAVKEGVTQFSNAVINVGKTVGVVVGRIIKAVISVFKQITDFVDKNPVLKFIFGLSPLSKFKFKIDQKDIKELQKNVEITGEATNKIVKLNRDNKQVIQETKTVITDTKPAIENLFVGTTKFSESLENVKSEADQLKEKFMEIGQGIEQGIVSNLTDAVMGTQTLAQAAVNVLNQLKRKLVEVAIQRAVSGIGNFIGGALGGIFGGGGGILGRTAVGTSNQFVGKASAAAFRANGGPVSAGGAFVVGEKGPELLQMGSRGGNIIPNNQLGGSTTNIVNVSVDASGSSVSGNTPDAQQLGNLIGAAIQERLIKEKRSGGLLSR